MKVEVYDRLRSVFSDKQARALVELVEKEDIVTKNDLKEVEIRLREEIVELKEGIIKVKQEAKGIKEEVSRLRNWITVFMGAIGILVSLNLWIVIQIFKR